MSLTSSTRHQPIEDPAAELRARERGIIWIRWAGIAFAILQVSLEAPATQPLGYGLAIALIGTNLAITWANGHLTTLRARRVLGLGALAADVAVLLGFTYLYAFQEHGSTWLVLYLAPLEAALRYRLRGVIVTAAAVSLLYLPREVFRQLNFDYPISVPSIAFRLGLLWIVALFAGFNSRQLARERDEARQLVKVRSALLTQIEEVDRLKSDFISSVSHELRTPLTILIGYVELLQARHDRLSPEQRATFLAEMDKAGRRLSNRIEALLDFAVLEGAPLKLDPRRVPLATLVREAIESQGPAAATAQVQVTCAVIDDLVVEADPARLGTALGHLIENAIKFNHPGGTVAITRDRRADTVVLEIRDSGIGIPTDRLAAIFQPFVHLETGDRKQYAGQGLGLTLARRIIEAHGGRVEVESEVGVGSTFRVVLPLARPDPARIGD